MRAVLELRGRFGDSYPFHVWCRGLGVVRVGVQQGVDGGGDKPRLDRLEHLRVPEDGGEVLARRGPCRPSGVLCGGVGWLPVGDGVEPPVRGTCLEAVPGIVLWVVADALGVPYGDGVGAACVPSVVLAEEW